MNQPPVFSSHLTTVRGVQESCSHGKSYHIMKTIVIYYQWQSLSQLRCQISSKVGGTILLQKAICLVEWLLSCDDHESFQSRFSCIEFIRLIRNNLWPLLPGPYIFGKRVFCKIHHDQICGTENFSLDDMLEENNCYGHPVKDVTVVENVVKGKLLIKEIPRISCEEMQDALGISLWSVNNFLHDHLNISNYCAHWFTAEEQ